MRVKRSELLESVQIVADADRLTSRAGTALLVGLSDRVGLTGARMWNGARLGPGARPETAIWPPRPQSVTTLYAGPTGRTTAGSCPQAPRCRAPPAPDSR